WEYQRDYPKGVNPQAARNKNIGIYEDMIYFAAPDGVLIALDAKTGAVRWETKVDNGGQTAGGMLVADGKVITSRTCEMAKRENCFIAAHDAKTGKEVWKFYSTAAPGEPGGDTWADMPVEQRAAGPWGLPGSYELKRKLIYWGIANPNPYTRLTRHGRYDAVPFTAPANLYSNSTVALDISTGKLAWYYQELPGDDWDADHNQERILVRARVNPDPKHVKWIAHAVPRNQERDLVVTVGEGGGMFVVDQESGKFLWANPFPYDDPNIKMNHIDLAKINLSTGEMRVLHSQPQPANGSALTTAGDLVFWGDLNRRFRAFDADTGKILWESVVGGMVMTSTITYAVNGKQYVLVNTGEGQSVTSGPLNLTKEAMPKAIRGHNSVVVFALPYCDRSDSARGRF